MGTYCSKCNHANIHEQAEVPLINYIKGENKQEEIKFEYKKYIENLNFVIKIQRKFKTYLDQKKNKALALESGVRINRKK